MKKKAFTLIELLVVIAIIAILAAILFPVFAQAKLAAKETAGLSNAKQMGLAALMYVNDYDDTFPLAGVLRPTIGGVPGAMGMGVAVPYPYNDGESIGGTNTIWQSAARQSMAASYAANAVQPYVKSLVLESLTGLNNYQNTDTFGGTGFVAPGLSSLAYNGDLHRYPTTAVVEPSIVPMWSPGAGSDNLVGLASSNPVLNCGNTVDDCIFTPGGDPTPSGVGAFAGAPGDTPLLEVASDTSAVPWVYQNMRGPMVRCDGSAKSYNLNAPIYPAYLTGNGAWLEPNVAYLTPAQNVARGGGNYWQSYFDVCSDGATLWNGTNPASVIDTYSCFFRPDRTK
jgi:prepilin-type N-terminal cleavage/methylation domain-containing protein